MRFFVFFYSAFKPPILHVFEKLFSVSVVFKYVFLVIAPVDYMIKSAGIFNPQRSGHLFCLYFIFGRFFRWDFYMERKWKCQYLVVAVGMPVTRHPPHRAQACGTTALGSCLMSNAEMLIRVWVQHPRSGNPLHHLFLHTFPG